MAGAGWAAALGGPGFPDILTALGTALLSSPRDAPFANLPQTLQAATQAGQQRQSNAAMGLALTKAGVDPETAATLAMNPTAASLMIAQQNLQKQLDIGTGLNTAIGGVYGSTAGNMGLGAKPQAAPAVPPVPAPTGAPASPVSAAPGNNPFLNLVSRAEGTDPGVSPQASGLNTTLAYGRFSGGPRDLTGMTVNQVLDMQKEMLNHPQNNLNSSAAGAFQVVGKTLRQLRDAGVVSGDDPYDANTQTKIGNHLALTRGRDAGGLRQEWAGLKGVPDDQILAAYDAAYGPNARGPAQAGGPAFPPQVLPGTQSPPTQVAQAPTGTVSDAQPVQVAAAGGKIPVPIPPDATKPLAESGYGAETTTMRELAKRKQAMALQIIAKSAAMGDLGKPYAEVGKLMFEDAAPYLKPTDTERALDAAGITDPAQRKPYLLAAADKRPEPVRLAEFAHGGTANEPPAIRAAREAVRLGLPDNSPEVVKLGRAKQDTPGQVASGLEVGAQREQANAEATARAKLAETSTSGAIAIEPLQNALKQASSSYKKIADMGGIGALQANPVSRWFDRHAATDAPPDSLLRYVLPKTLTDAHSIEVERQQFDNAMAMVKNTVTAIRNKGQGPVSNVERVLLSADLEGMLASPDRQVAEQALGRLQADIDRAVARDKEMGLYRGEQPIQTPYGVLREKR
jgi:hypothetical protein